MKRNKGMGGIYAGIVIAAVGLLLMALPFVFGADMPGWGYAAVLTGFLILASGIVTLLLYLHRRKVLKRMIEGREVLARWTYDMEYWRSVQMEEVKSNKGMPVFGAAIGGIFVVIGLVFFLSDPDDMGGMLAAMAGIGVLIAFVAWLSAALRNRAVLKDPGEAVIARGGVYYKGFLIDWNGKTSWFDVAKVVRKKKHANLIIGYRYIAGRYVKMYSDSIAIPVPKGKEQEAESVANRLNGQPY